VQRVRIWVTQRPQLTRHRDDHVQGGNWQVGGYPPGRRGDASTHVAAMHIGLLRDQGEIPL
jgi:hypothetical protein